MAPFVLWVQVSVSVCERARAHHAAHVGVLCHYTYLLLVCHLGKFTGNSLRVICASLPRRHVASTRVAVCGGAGSGRRGRTRAVWAVPRVSLKYGRV